MARRVNTRFVVVLSAALVAAVAAVVGIKLVHWSQQNDPDRAKARGEAAEKAGDLKAAILDYRRAAFLLSQKHRSGADPLYAYTAELCMKVSRNAQTQEDAVRYFQTAMECYRAALQENPRNVAVNETLMEEFYQNAQYFPATLNWKALEDVAAKLIANHDAAKPRLYRAEAHLRVAQSSPTTMTPRELADIDADLTAAQRFEPQSNEAVALRAELMWLQSRLSVSRRHLTTAEELTGDDQYQREIAAVRQMLINCLAGRWDDGPTPGWNWLTRISLRHVDADVALTLASMTVDQFRLSGGTDRSRLDAAVALMEAAFAVEPDKAVLADGLGGLYLATNQADKAEELFKQIVKRSPEKPEGYFRLARFYRERGETAKAIDSYTDVTRHPTIGVGRDAIRNADYQIQAVEGIAWLNMDQAERAATASEEATARLKDAAEATEKLRVSHAPAGVVNLLEGRMLLINRDFPRAVATLHKAEANLNGVPAFVERYRQTKLMLARANDQQNQLGAALDCVNEALALRPTDLSVMIYKGQLFLRLRRFDETRVLMERILGGPEGRFVNEADLPPAIATAARNLLLAASGAQNPAVLQAFRGTLQAALLEMNSEDYESAAADAEEALGKADLSSEDAARAYQIAIICNVQLKRNEQAKTFAAKALEKYPANPTFQVFKARLDDPQGAATPEGQKRIIEAITDDYVRALSLASFFHQQKQWGEEIAILQKIRETYRLAATADDRDKFSNILDRLFVAALVAADSSTAPKQGEYWQKAQALVTDIEKLNLDGTDGKIYRGRLEMARTNGQSGVQYLQEAVQQRPDYAYAHQILGQAYYSLAALNASKGSAASTTYFDSSLEEFRQVIRLAPNNLVALQYAIELLVRKGDSAGLKEAQGLLESGLALAPHNSRFIGYQEILLANVDSAIKSRVGLLKSQPDDRDNLRRLAGLYVRKKDKETQPDEKQKAMDNAIALLESDYQNHKDELVAGDLLARMLVEYDKSDKGASRAIDIYAGFIASPDQAVRFNARIAKAEFFRNLLLRSDAIQALVAAKRIGHDDLRAEAADILQQAKQDEPASQDDAERHLADMYFDLGRMADAEKEYLGIIEKNKTPSATDRVTRRLIEAELRQAKYADAAPRLETLLKNQPRDIQGLTLRAFASIQQGVDRPLEDQQKALKAALADLNLVLTLDVGNGEALLFRATAQIMLGDRLDDAEKDLIQAAKQERTTLNARMLLAQLYVRSQRYEEAAREYQGLVKLRPDMVNVRLEYLNFLKNLAELQLTLPKDSDAAIPQSLRRLGPLEKFMDDVSTAAERYPNDPRWWLLKAQGFALQGKNLEAQSWFKAIYDQLIKQGVIDAQVSDAYLASLLRSRSYDEAVKLSSNIIDSSGDFISKNPQYVTFYLKRAAAYQGLNKPVEAVQDIDRGFAVGVAAASQTGDYGPFITVLNEASTPLAVPEAATPGAGTRPVSVLSPELVAERLRVRIAADPQETVSKIGLIQTLLIMNRPAEALQVVDTLSTTEKNPTLRMLVLRQSALVRCQNKQYAAAEKDFKEIDRIAPHNVENLNNYAFMLADGMNRPKEAIVYAQRALKLLATRSDLITVTSNSANVYDTLGWAYYLNNDVENAIANLRSSVKVQPQAAAYLHLALSLQKAGRKDEALVNCQEGIKLATVRHDAETLAALQELQTKLTP
jgi:tetratricopeptide (TPR) repeat protein